MPVLPYYDDLRAGSGSDTNQRICPSIKRVLWICNCDLLRMLIYMIGIMM